ncbi:NAD(P)/FAD-dependent oxidoreductase [Spirosoma koreense]
MMHETDVLIIGGGLAGLTAALHLAQQHVRVILLEKHAYPQHKVCGEYVSNEVLPYLQQLGIDIDPLKPSRLQRFLFSTISGKTIGSELPLGGFGLSRYTFDHFLYQKATEAGARVFQEQVLDVVFENDVFNATTSEGNTYRSTIAIGAYGKRSNLDKQLQRSFIQNDSPWIGVKAHYEADYPDQLVSLHHFDGGYCGLSRVEDNRVNACYLTHYRSFKKHRNLMTFQQQVMQQNPWLKEFFSKATPLFDKPLSISQISFDRKEPVEQHMLMCGDTAGVIHPLCGNGMAMAIHSAKLASELILDFLGGKLATRRLLEQQYRKVWNDAFQNRLTTGRIVQSFLQHGTSTAVLLRSLQLLPAALPLLIRQTHGKPLVAR